MMSSFYLAFPENISVLEAGQKFLEQKSHTALVINEQQQLIGVVTLNDLKRKIQDNSISLTQLQLKDICTSQVLCTYPEETIITALERMETRGLYLLPVVSQDNPDRVLGVINKEQINLAGDLITTKAALSNFVLVANSN
jgi:CBS-domain-containing membrane protein